MNEPDSTNRSDRRKARTRAALVAAARQLLASRNPETVSIQEITDTADVGFGSFYNHFETKDELFDAAIEQVMEEHGQLIDAATRDMHDPAQVFTTGVRMTARLPKTHPEIARILERTGIRYLDVPDGLGPRAVRDLQAGAAAGLFHIRDVRVAAVSTVGAVLGAIYLATLDPTPSAIDAVADEVALGLLRMFGVPADHAEDLASRPLPDLSHLEPESPSSYEDKGLTRRPSEVVRPIPETR